jgi:nitroimidazol reductase NimA-like FMN-containing flavoprotein (pyridoxamine 5'-phosphate oxidase superfamily)
MTEHAPPSERARVKRYNHIARYDPAAIHAILDAMPLCHVGYVFGGTPYVTPTLQWRDGNRIFWHGSAASRMLESAETKDVCVTVSLYDGLVMSRSAYNYNINHRSVMIFGQPEKLPESEKEAQLRNMVNRTIPGQWERLRPVTPKELKATTVLTMPITEASAKIRAGAPEDDEEDYSFPVWAGVIPVKFQVLPAEPDPRNLAGLEPPAEIAQFKIG